ncbi:hypothetical protein ACGFOU_34560 [Streptomyces sp. NPDC048595]|uniref:hypothetical protein n=1 Tax=Streptomyces sp. NPDC048595 TaxID=3365576 RepID=UPI003722A856
MNDPGKNDPLPVQSRDNAEQLARRLAETLAGQYSLKVDGSTVNKEFRDCFGKDHEHASDGRFDLTYSVRAKLPGDEHGKALRAMRKKLEASHYKISGYREDKSDALMDAKGGHDNLFISVESYMPATELVFSISTPCFLPPGVKQQQLSAPAPKTTPTAPALVAKATAPVRRFPDNPFG